MNRINGSRFALVTFGMTLVVLLSGITPFTSLYAQARPKMQIAFVSEREGNSEIYVMDENGKNLQNLTNHPADDWGPTFGFAVGRFVSPSGKRATVWGQLKRVEE